MSIPVGVKGTIVASTMPGHFERVEDDRVNTGGFLVYEGWEGSNGPNADGAHDSWVESEAALCQFFQESRWVIQWHA
jgi:hypothetical protein